MLKPIRFYSHTKKDNLKKDLTYASVVICTCIQLLLQKTLKYWPYSNSK